MSDGDKNRFILANIYLASKNPKWEAAAHHYFLVWAASQSHSTVCKIWLIDWFWLLRNWGISKTVRRCGSDFESTFLCLCSVYSQTASLPFKSVGISKPTQIKIWFQVVCVHFLLLLTVLWSPSPAGSSLTAPAMCGVEPPQRQITVRYTRADSSLCELVDLTLVVTLSTCSCLKSNIIFLII